jgi:hypothetical protein
MVTAGSTTNRRAVPSPLLLLLVVLIVLVAAGAAFVVLHRPGHTRPAQPLSDEQSKAQVVEPAKQIVAIGALQKPAGGYMLMSCMNEADPPYQGAIYVTFELPKSLDYIDRVAAAMTPHGWQKGPPPEPYLLGTTLNRNGVTAILYRDPDRDGLGIMKVYGECRNVADHRADVTGWTDITDQLH